MPVSTSMSRALKATSGMLFSDLVEPIIMEDTCKVYDLKDLPFKPVVAGQSTASLKTVMIVKTIRPVDGADPTPLPDLVAAKELFKAEGLDGLIGQTMGLDGSVPAGSVQWCVLTGEFGIKVVMLMEFPKRATVALLLKAVGDGELFQIDTACIASPRSVSTPIHFMFENMGGSILLTRTLTVSEKSNSIERSLSAEDIDQGLQYLAERGPTSSCDILPFALKEHVSTDSPLSGWQMSWIKEACRDRLEHNFKARTIADYPLTIHDLSSWCVHHLLAPALHYATSNSILWAGEPGVGKTPVANAIANVISEWHRIADELPSGPSFKTASDLDMYRGELGSRQCPYIYDDGATDHDSVPRLKAFLDVSWGYKIKDHMQNYDGKNDKHVRMIMIKRLLNEHEVDGIED
eukprot:6488925-Amphidinium_carterae.1